MYFYLAFLYIIGAQVVHPYSSIDSEKVWKKSVLFHQKYLIFIWLITSL